MDVEKNQIYFLSKNQMLEFLKSLIKSSQVFFSDDSNFEKKMNRKNHILWIKLGKGTDEFYSVVPGHEFMKGSLEDMDTKRGKRKETWINAAFFITPTTLESNEFYHETAINFLVKKYLSDVPAYSRAEFQWSNSKLDGDCVICFKKVEGTELEPMVPLLTAKEIHSILFQVFVAIRLAQHRIQLKHHDFHLKNIIITPSEKTEWVVETPEGVQTVPICGLEATIIDYGLSSATDPESKLRLKRADEKLLMNPGSGDTGDSWGVWDSTLEGDEGYDFAMLVESFVEELFLERPLSIPKLDLISNLQRFITVDFTDRGRPKEKNSLDWEKIFLFMSTYETK